LLVDYKSGALDAHVLTSVHALFFPHAIGLGDDMFRVRNQGKRQAVLGRKFCMSRRLVRRDTNDRSVFLGKGFIGDAKLARLGSSPRRIRLREKE
jgi:hypothetical protein